jgi:hypothetical protein
MYVEKIDIETATAEVKAFLDARKIRPKRMESMEPFIPHMIEAVSLGFLVFEKDSVKMILETPVGENGQFTELEFCYRVAPEKLRAAIARLKNAAIEDKMMTAGLEHCITKGVVPGIINKLETGDYNIFNALAAIFFT